MKHRYSVGFVFIIFVASSFQQDSSLKDNTVFEETPAYHNEEIQVGLQTKDVDPPAGHMKQMGEHGVPIIGEITELNYMINGKDFYEKFARKRKPLVFRGVTRNWNSTKYWKDEKYLLEKYSDVLFDVETGKVYDDDLNTRRTMDMREFLNEYRNKTLYLDSPFPQTPMTEDMELPLMLQCEDKYKSFMSMHLLFSNGGTSSPLHHDGYENFLSVFSGIKVVYVMEPKYGKEVYANFVKDFPGLSPISPEAVDLVKYPLFKGVPFHKVVLKPGDMLYIPQFWYHQVRSFESPNIAASMWFMLFPIKDMAEVGYRDVLNVEEKFALSLEKHPETIECNHQNRPMNELFNDEKIDLRKFVEKEVVAESVINKVELNDKVLPGQPTIYVGSDDTYIYAVDMLNGKVKWRIKTEQDTGSTCHFNHDNTLVYCGADDGAMRAMFVNNGSVLWDYVISGPVISSVKLDDEGNLYFGGLDYYMYSLYENGTKRWRRFLGNQIWSTPLLYPESDLVVIAIKAEKDSENRSNTFGLHMSTGGIVWRFKAEGGVVSSPRLSHTGSSVFICSVRGWFYELDIREGSVIYKLNLNATEGEVDLLSTPAVNKDGTVYVLMASGKLVAIDTVNRNVKWNIDLKELKEKDNVEVTEDDRGSNSSPLLSSDGTLYVGAGFGVVFALDSTNGEIKWQKRIGAGIFFSSPRLSKDNVLYIGAIDGPLVALDSQTGNLIWSMKSDGPLVGTPLITRGFEA